MSRNYTLTVAIYSRISVIMPGISGCFALTVFKQGSTVLKRAKRGTNLAIIEVRDSIVVRIRSWQHVEYEMI